MITDMRTGSVIQKMSKTEELMQSEKGRQEVFGKAYFNGGRVHGGYANEGFRDFAVHHQNAQFVLNRNPKSVLELGCGRGYVLKRIQDAGLIGQGLEISKHCHMTRACDNIRLQDLCSTPWTYDSTVLGKADVCYSIAVLEHIPEQFLPAIIHEMERVSHRGLHGIDFGEKDDGFDRTHVLLRSPSWWVEKFNQYAPNYPVEIVDKEHFKADVSPAILHGDGKVKLNLGSFTSMFHHGWINVDVHDLTQWAASQGYKFQRLNIQDGLPYATESVDLLYLSHVLEHFTYKQAISLLREFRRVIKPDGAIRILVPDAELLTHSLGLLDQYEEINDEFPEMPTQMMKMHSLLYGGDHKAIYDEESLSYVLKEAGWIPKRQEFRKSDHKQFLTECVDSHPCLSLVMEATPKLG